MGLNTNIQFYRKLKGITQEQLGETLGVSRQTISKWESGASHPEMDKLLQLCDIFNCDLDTLMRGDAENAAEVNADAYESHYKYFTFTISAGVGLILLGVTVLLFLSGLSINETIGGMVFFVFLIIAVVLLILGSMDHNNFVKKYPHIQPFYTQTQVDAYNRKFPFLIAIPTALILLGVVWIIGADSLPTPQGYTWDAWEYLFVSVFMLMVTIAVTTYVYAGIQKDKYDIEGYNKENDPNREKSFTDRISGCIMLIATAIFLLLGFVWNLWYISWVAFPIGGLLCAAVSAFSKDSQ